MALKDAMPTGSFVVESNEEAATTLMQVWHQACVKCEQARGSKSHLLGRSVHFHDIAEGCTIVSSNSDGSCDVQVPFQGVYRHRRAMDAFALEFAPEYMQPGIAMRSAVETYRFSAEDDAEKGLVRAKEPLPVKVDVVYNTDYTEVISAHTSGSTFCWEVVYSKPGHNGEPLPFSKDDPSFDTTQFFLGVGTTKRNDKMDFPPNVFYGTTNADQFKKGSSRVKEGVKLGDVLRVEVNMKSRTVQVYHDGVTPLITTPVKLPCETPDQIAEIKQLRPVFNVSAKGVSLTVRKFYQKGSWRLLPAPAIDTATVTNSGGGPGAVSKRVKAAAKRGSASVSTGTGTGAHVRTPSQEELPAAVLARRPGLDDADTGPERATLLALNADGSCKVAFAGGLLAHAVPFDELELVPPPDSKTGRRLTQSISLFRETMDLDVDGHQKADGTITIERIRRRKKLTKLLNKHETFLNASPNSLRLQIAYPEDPLNKVENEDGTYETCKMDAVREATEIMDKTCGPEQKKANTEAEPSGLDTEMVQEQEQEQEHSIEIEAVEEEVEETENNFLKVWGAHTDYAYTDILDIDKHEEMFPKIKNFEFNHAAPALPFPDRLRLSRNFAPIDYAGELLRPLKNVNVVVYVESTKADGSAGREGHAVIVSLLEAQMLRTCLFEEMGHESPSSLLDAQMQRGPKMKGRQRHLSMVGMCTVGGTWLWKHTRISARSALGSRLELQGWKFEPPRTDDEVSRKLFAQLLYCAKFFNAEFYFKAHEVG